MSKIKDVLSDTKEFVIKSIEDAVQLKDVLFQKEKGEALKRGSTPRDEYEAAALGIFEAQANAVLNAIKALEKDINWLCNLEDNSLSEFADNLFRGTGSRKGRRLELTLQTVSDIKPDVNMGMTNIRPQPAHYGYEDTKSGTREGFPRYGEDE